MPTDRREDAKTKKKTPIEQAALDLLNGDKDVEDLVKVIEKEVKLNGEGAVDESSED